MKTKDKPTVALSLFVLLINVIAYAQLPTNSYVEGELLVKFAGGPRGDAAKRAKDVMKHEIRRHFDFIGWQHVRLPAGMTVEKGLAQYRNMPDVLAVEPNIIEPAVPPVRARAGDGGFRAGKSWVVPNDRLFDEQYGLARIAASNAWAVSIGSTNVVVAVLDTGINYSHEDLRANMWRNPGEIPTNGIDDDGNGFADDVYGLDVADDASGNDSDPIDVNTEHVGYHGSACAGIIGAVGNNALGISGVNWVVQLMAVRCVQSRDFIAFADEVQALEYVLLMKQRGVNLRVVSTSWGGYTFSQAVRDARIAVGNAGIVQVAIAGNFSNNNDANPFYPASYPASNMIAVAASDPFDNLAGFSSYGRTNVDLAAPGVGILTTAGGSTSAYYGSPGVDGTSFAGPHVAGAAALLFAANPGASADNVKAALLETVDVLPAFTNKMISNGRLNIGRAILHPGLARTNQSPTIVSLPQFISVLGGEPVAFTAVVGGASPLFYQWRFERNDLLGVTNDSFTLNSASPSDAGDYTLVVSNAFGVTTSAAVHLHVLTNTIVFVQPTNQTVIESNTVTFRVNASGPPPLAYQWRFHGTNLPGAISTNLVLSTVQANQAGDYTVEITSPFDVVTSAVAVLTVLVPPQIIQPLPPLRFSAVPGETLTLSVETRGTLPIGYRWRHLRTNGTSANLTNLVLNQNRCFFALPVTTNSAGTYMLLLTNVAQPTSGPQRTNTVLTLLADSDADGLPDAWEATYPQATDAAADIDNDGLTNLQEYQTGTDPTNELSNLKVDSISLINGGMSARIIFLALSNKTYTLQSRDAVASGPWTRVTDILAMSSNRVVEIIDDPMTEVPVERYYRLVTPRRP